MRSVAEADARGDTASQVAGSRSAEVQAVGVQAAEGKPAGFDQVTVAFLNGPGLG